MRSPAFTLKVVELPYVKKLDLEYKFPAYTGLEPRKIEDGGDIAVLNGTDVSLTITPTMASKGGRIVIGEKESVPLTAAADGTLTAAFTARQDGFYRVELDGPSGEKVTASPQYTIDMLSDQTPTVTVGKPGRDTDATPVQEFVIEVRADDDYAVKNLRVGVFGQRWSREEHSAVRRPPGDEGSDRRPHSLSRGARREGGRLGLVLRARHRQRRRRRPEAATSDMYFLRIRPFDKDFKPAMSMAGGGGGGGGGGMDQVGALSQQQRQIIAGTFKMQRDRKQTAADKFREGMTVLTLSQSRLRESVEGLVERMNSRLVTPDPSFQKIAELLPKAAEAMKEAERQAPGRRLRTARCRPSSARCSSCSRRKKSSSCRCRPSATPAAAVAAARVPSRRIWRISFKMEMDKMANQYETTAARQPAAGRSAGGRTGREAEGAGPAPGAGTGTAAPHGRRPGPARQQQRSAARAGGAG